MTFANPMTLSAITIPYSYNEAFKTMEYNIAGADLNSVTSDLTIKLSLNMPQCKQKGEIWLLQ